MLHQDQPSHGKCVISCALPGNVDRGSPTQDAVSKDWFRSCSKGPANMTTVLSVALEISAGMSYLHDRGIVHGDLSAGEASASMLIGLSSCLQDVFK